MDCQRLWGLCCRQGRGFDWGCNALLVWGCSIDDFLRSLSPARRSVWGADAGAICGLRCRCRILLRRFCQRSGQEWIPDRNLTGVDCLKLSQPVYGRLYFWLKLIDGSCGPSGVDSFQSPVPYPNREGLIRHRETFLLCCRATLCPSFHQNWSYRSSCLRIRRRKTVSQFGFDSYRVRLTFLLLGTVRGRLARKVLLGGPLFPDGVVLGVPGFLTEFLCRLWLFHLWVVVREG